MSADQVTHVLVIRHGETAWNTASRIQGHIDIPLNDRGRWQAQRLALALQDEEIHAVYSSDLLRARHTAEAITQARQQPLQLDAQLRERHFGCYEGLTQAEVAAQWPEDARRWREREPGYGPQGGETLQGFYDRCITAITCLAHQHLGQTIVLVAHGGVLDCFYRAANRVPLQALRTWSINNANVNRLLYSPEGLRMMAWGDDRHLEEDAAPALDELPDGDGTQARTAAASIAAIQP